MSGRRRKAEQLFNQHVKSIEKRMMDMQNEPIKKKDDETLVFCNNCGKHFKEKGLARHQKVCLKEI
jgi:uncharacterized Zn finger protein